MDFLKIAKIFFSITIVLLVVLWLSSFIPLSGASTFGLCDPFDFEDEYAYCAGDICTGLVDFCVMLNQFYLSLIAINVIILVVVYFLGKKK